MLGSSGQLNPRKKAKKKTANKNKHNVKVYSNYDPEKKKKNIMV